MVTELCFCPYALSVFHILIMNLIIVIYLNSLQGECPWWSVYLCKCFPRKAESHKHHNNISACLIG